ncbi:nucleotidyl transferase AbiEii/AbiGii toxin family protein [Flavitalea flava]
MNEPLFEPFRLVGGTSLSLQLGHRLSVDVDLFTDAKYGSLDFHALDAFLRSKYKYVSKPTPGIVGMGRSYILGDNPQEAVKLDLYYTDPFIRDIKKADVIRLASLEEITAMKLDVVQRRGRKKDFWDLHILMDQFSLTEMLSLHKERYPYSHDENLIINHFTDFSLADEDFDPICLLGKHWEIIKSEIAEIV